MNDNDLTLASYLRELRQKRRSPRTVSTYVESLTDFTRFIDGEDLLAVERRQIEDYLFDLTDPDSRALAAGTAMLRFRDLRAFYNWAVREEILDVSPMAKVSAPKVVDDPPQVVHDDDLRRLLAGCAGKDFEARRDTAIIRIWCEPGSPRVSEMAGLDLDSVDMRRDQITMRGKGGKLRTIPFGAATGQAIDRYLRERRKQRGAARHQDMWLSSRGTPMTRSGLYQMLRRRAGQAGLEPIHPHQLRHTAAHVWAADGGSESDAMALFGWSSMEMPRRYGRSAQVERAQHSARRRSLGDRL
jgi:site-specific recombinase XerD